MDLGAFSISLAVQDLEISRDFYQKLGFEVFGGSLEYRYLILKNGNHVIGLFEKMFDKNIITFNPGWDQGGKNTDPFTDVRIIYDQLKGAGVEMTESSVNSESGPGSFSFLDPDGNPILIDQHR